MEAMRPPGPTRQGLRLPNARRASFNRHPREADPAPRRPGFASKGRSVKGFGYTPASNPLRRYLNAAVMAVVVLAASPHAATGAIDTAVRLEYQTDEADGCVGERELRRMVAEQLGHDPFKSDADRQVAIAITRSETGFQGRIVWTEKDGRPAGRRVLSSRSRDCQEIGANVAFTVALQLQLMEARRSSGGSGAAPSGPTPSGAAPSSSGPSNPGASNAASSSAAPSTDEPPVIPPRPANPAPKESDERPPPAADTPAGPAGTPDPITLAVGAGPAAAVRLLPETAALGRVFVMARWRQVSVEVGGDATRTATQREPDASAVAIDAIGASAAGCGHLSLMAACVLGRITWLRAKGSGVDVPAEAGTRFSQVGLRLGVARSFGRFAVGVHADGLWALSVWNVLLNDTIVWTVPRASGLIGVDLALRIF